MTAGKEFTCFKPNISQYKKYGGPEVTFSQSDFYKVNEIGYLTYFSCFIKSNEFRFQAFAARLL